MNRLISAGAASGCAVEWRRRAAIGIVAVTLALFGVEPASAIWGGQQYIAVPDISNAAGKVQIKRWYVVNNGRSATDAAGNVYQFANYIVKDTYYLDAKTQQPKLTRRASISIQVSGTNTGTLSIVETSQYVRPPQGLTQQIVTNQTLTQNLVDGNRTGQAVQGLNFRFKSFSTPPVYDTVGLLNTGFSFSAEAAAGAPTATLLSGSLCLSSQPNQPCPVLSTTGVGFSPALGWEVQAVGETVTVRAGTYTNVTTIQQTEPQVALQYSSGGCPSGSPNNECLLLGRANTGKATSWVAPGVGVIQYRGPFYVGGLTLGYELRRILVY